MARTKAHNPCHGCGRRNDECHAGCPEYAVYAAIREQERDDRTRKRKAEHDTAVVVFKRLERERKRRL